MIRILTDLSTADGLPPLPGLECEVISDPAIQNKVIVLKYDESKTLPAALKMLQERARVIPFNTTYKNQVA